MSPNRCPVCGCIVADGAQPCEACWTDLGGWNTEPSPLQAWLPVDSSGALWLDDLGGPQATSTAVDSAPVSAPSRVHDTFGSTTAPPVALSAAELPSSHVEAKPSATLARRATDALGTTPMNEAELKSARKAAKRAQVQHARLRSVVASRAFAPADAEVLIVDPDPTSREQLCSVLGAFGFGVLAIAGPMSSPTLAAPRTFVAVFVSLAAATVDGGDGIDFCQQLRGAGHHAEAIVLVAGQLRPVDRVRADLAGCDETIPQPVTRGIVARVMDDRGIALPSDARRS
ncbi:MAG: hypothetical protein ABL916_01075 [Burkholderiaceae bacterium]